MKKKFVLLIFIVLTMQVLPQKTLRVCGEADFVIPKNMSLMEAEAKAIHQAQVQALIGRFGQVVHEDNALIGTTIDGLANESFYSYGGSEAKGEWIETIGEPNVTTMVDEVSKALVIHASVCGMAREISSAGIEVSSTVLCNGIDVRFASTDFKDGDNIYLLFQAPTDGYLCLYLLDPTAQNVLCLLPYRHSSSGAVSIQHDEKYLFFHPDNRYPYARQADRIRMTCEREVEYNDLYVVFSPNRFAKAQNAGISDGQLPQVSQKAFFDWLTKCRTKDKDMVVQKHRLKIERMDN